jgi:hypothetical protein
MLDGIANPDHARPSGLQWLTEFRRQTAFAASENLNS